MILIAISIYSSESEYLGIKEVVNMPNERYFAAISANCPLHKIKSWAREHNISVISGMLILPQYDDVVELNLADSPNISIAVETILDNFKPIGHIGYDQLLGEAVAVITPIA